MTNNSKKPAFALVTLVLPGPDRKRQPVPYHYRITFRAPDATRDEPGCVATWEIYGGREEYQLSLERTVGGELLWHCTCPDSTYRAHDNNPHYCKHIRALRELFALVTPLPDTARQSQAAEAA